MELDMPESTLPTDIMEDPNKKEVPERIPPPEQVAEDSAESIADSFEQDTRKQLNLLRERTFNPELRTLVERVRENEPG